MAINTINDAKRSGILKVGSTKNNLVSLPDPKSVTNSIQTLVSENSGRNVNNGKMDIEVIANKEKLSIDFGILNSSDVSFILKLINKTEFYCRYFSALEGAYVTKQMYCGDRTAPVLVRMSNGLYAYQSMTVDFIEL